MGYIIEVQNVSKSYKEQKVLDDVDISFEEGKIHGIVGRNGSGKTVLMKIICGFIKPDQGVVTVDNKVIGKDIDFAENIGVIIENTGFLPTQNGFKNLKYLASLRNKIADTEIKEAIISVGLNPEDKKQVDKYSLGMKQRLGIAQAIMENPKILLLDEPMNGLDNDGVAEIRKLFLKLKEEGKTILIVSHHAEDIKMLCDNVYEMDRGRLTKRADL